MYVGAIMPWREFHQPDTTGITLPRLIGLAVMVLLFRRIPVLLASYKAMPNVLKNWKEALFMGYFGPIGVGAVYYVEHTRHLFPKETKASEGEVHLLEAIEPSTFLLSYATSCRQGPPY